MVDIAFRRIVTMLDDARISKNDRMVGNITIDIGVWCNQYIVSHCDITYDCGIYAYPHFISYFRRALARASVFLANRHTLVQAAIISDDHLWVDGNVVGVAQIQPFPDIRFAGDLDSPSVCQAGKDKAIPILQQYVVTGLAFSIIKMKVFAVPPPAFP